MASAAPAPTLTCSQCAYVNEAERVYCHHCGTKLDRSVLPPGEEVTKESLEQARKRVQRITNPNGFRTSREIKKLFTILLYAFLFAGIIQLLRAPADLPEPPNREIAPRIISSELSDILEQAGPHALQYTEEEVNGYLASTLRSKATTILPGAKFVRAYARLEPGNVFLGLEQSILGVSLYSGTRYQIGVEGGQFVARNQGGSLGRIAIHPVVMKGLTLVFSPLFGALKREHAQCEGMQQVKVEKGSILLVTKGAGR